MISLKSDVLPEFIHKLNKISFKENIIFTVARTIVLPEDISLGFWRNNDVFVYGEEGMRSIPKHHFVANLIDDMMARLFYNDLAFRELLAEYKVLSFIKTKNNENCFRISKLSELNISNDGKEVIVSDFIGEIIPEESIEYSPGKKKLRGNMFMEIDGNTIQELLSVIKELNISAFIITLEPRENNVYFTWANISKVDIHAQCNRRTVKLSKHVYNFLIATMGAIIQSCIFPFISQKKISDTIVIKYNGELSVNIEELNIILYSSKLNLKNIFLKILSK